MQLWASGNWQLHQDNAPTHASCLVQRFLAKYQITQVIQPPYSPDLSPCDFWLFPKLKSPLKGKRFQTVNKIQENITGQLIASGRTVWGPKIPTLKGTETSSSYIQCFLYLVPSTINISNFHVTFLDTFWTDLLHTSRMYVMNYSFYGLYRIIIKHKLLLEHGSNNFKTLISKMINHKVSKIQSTIDKM